MDMAKKEKWRRKGFMRECRAKIKEWRRRGLGGYKTKRSGMQVLGSDQSSVLPAGSARFSSWDSVGYMSHFAQKAAIP